MRILHLIGSLSREIGSPTEACLQMARAVAARGHQVAIFTTNWTIGGVEPVPVGVPLQQDGITITYFPVHFPPLWKPSLAMIPALRRDLAPGAREHVELEIDADGPAILQPHERLAFDEAEPGGADRDGVAGLADGDRLCDDDHGPVPKHGDGQDGRSGGRDPAGLREPRRRRHTGSRAPGRCAAPPSRIGSGAASRGAARR